MPVKQMLGEGFIPDVWVWTCDTCQYHVSTATVDFPRGWKFGGMTVEDEDADVFGSDACLEEYRHKHGDQEAIP